MKEYINRLSLGKFRYDIPDIIKPDDVVRDLDIKAPFTSKYGFSVVAPISMTVPSSTYGRR